ncbi:MAG: helix-turn-helix transcriptional regulator [Clostridia bacterium]|nr:helix-turn-helix transcriptional regulator [Clostridia bacterium]
MQCISVIAFRECITGANWDYPNITRPFSIIYYALGGSAFYTVNGVEKPFKKNHLYILPANRVFSLRELPQDKFYSLYIHAYTFPEINSVVEIDISSDEFIADTLKMTRTYAKKSRDKELYINRLTDMLLSYIFRASAIKDGALPVRVKKYIDSNFVEVFKDADLSNRFNYSNSHISKLFKAEYKQTPKQYAGRLILREIIVLLYSELPIAEIARRLSFSSPENLCRFFKSAYNCSPTEYLQKYKSFPL